MHCLQGDGPAETGLVKVSVFKKRGDYDDRAESYSLSLLLLLSLTCWNQRVAAPIKRPYSLPGAEAGIQSHTGYS